MNYKVIWIIARIFHHPINCLIQRDKNVMSIWALMNTFISKALEWQKCYCNYKFTMQYVLYFHWYSILTDDLDQGWVRAKKIWKFDPEGNHTAQKEFDKNIVSFSTHHFLDFSPPEFISQLKPHFWRILTLFFNSLPRCNPTIPSRNLHGHKPIRLSFCYHNIWKI